MKTIIFGAGNYAKRLFEYLYARDKAKDLVCFAVSDTTSNPESLYGFPVKSIQEFEEYIDDYYVYFALNPVLIDEAKGIISLCKKQNYSIVSQKDFKDLIRRTEEVMYLLDIQDDLIFISCFQGQGYKCNMKYLSEYIRHSGKKLNVVWNIRPEFMDGNGVPDDIKLVERGTIEYRRALHTARVIVTNDEMLELRYKKKGQYIINTWHGTGPFKKVNASDYQKSHRTLDYLDQLRGQQQRFDLYVSNSKDNTEMFRKSFLYCGEIAEWGSPRNDILFSYTEEMADSIRAKLGIPKENGVVLYAPTFRESTVESYSKYDIDPKSITDALKDKYNKEFSLLYRYHHHLYHAGKSDNLTDKGIDVTDYLDIMELLVISDVVVTDYSSVMWDFSLLRRPVFLYQPDLDDYIKSDRDFYWPVEEWPYPRAGTMAKLCEIIKNFDDSIYQKELSEFFKKDPSFDDGHACERLFKRICEKCFPNA